MTSMNEQRSSISCHDHFVSSLATRRSQLRSHFGRSQSQFLRIRNHKRTGRCQKGVSQQCMRRGRLVSAGMLPSLPGALASHPPPLSSFLSSCNTAASSPYLSLLTCMAQSLHSAAPLKPSPRSATALALSRHTCSARSRHEESARRDRAPVAHIEQRPVSSGQSAHSARDVRALVHVELDG